MNPCTEQSNSLPNTVQASLEARLAPFRPPARTRPVLQNSDQEAALAVMLRQAHQPRTGLIKDLKLLLAALGAGNSVVPLGDNSCAARRLSEYADSLRD